MPDLKASTSLSADQVLAKADAYFIHQLGMVLIERVKHYHGRKGAVQISVAGTTLETKKKYHAETVLNELGDYAERQYDLAPVHILMHLHPSHEEDSGHLLLQVNFSYPVEIRIETEAFEAQAREFIATLSAGTPPLQSS